MLDCEGLFVRLVEFPSPESSLEAQHPHHGPRCDVRSCVSRRRVFGRRGMAHSGICSVIFAQSYSVGHIRRKHGKNILISYYREVDNTASTTEIFAILSVLLRLDIF